MISAAVIAAGMLASCSNKEIVDEQPETDGVSASVLNIVPTVGTDTRAGFVPKTEWAVNDAMGLFMYKATGWGDAYPRLGDGKGDTAVFRAWLLLFLPAGGYGQQDKEAADYRCY